MLRKPNWLLATTTALALVLPTAASAQDARTFDLPAQPLGEALQQVSAQSGQQIIVASALTDGKRSVALHGQYRANDAVVALLRGTGLRAVRVGDALVIQAVAPEEEDNPPGDVVVTGTRIHGRGPVGSAVTTIDRKAIEESGFVTIQQIAQSIPQNFGGGPNESTSPSGTLDASAGMNFTSGSSLNLRGLGGLSTLVLLNGDRMALSGLGGAFADVSVIPASAVERLEIVADGSSAIYGSDAVAGVVNIVPRLHFKGAETSLRYGTADGAAQEFMASQIIGKHWSGGDLIVSYEFYRRNRLAASDRSFATDDLRRFGGADRRNTYAMPGTIYAGGKSFAIPSGQNGIGLTAAQLTAGTVNLGDSWAGTDILPEQQRHSGFAALSQHLTDNLRFYANGIFSSRSFDQRVRSSQDLRRTVPVTNPFYVDPIGTHQPVGVDYSFKRDLGAERSLGTETGYSAAAGVEAKQGPWTIDARGTFGKSEQEYDGRNLVNYVTVPRALADPNPATAYNLFGDGASQNPDTVESIRVSRNASMYGQSWSATLRADGPVIAAPAGDVRLAVGGEYRVDKFGGAGSVYFGKNYGPNVNPPVDFGPARRVRAAYAEVLLPILGGAATLPGFHRLDLSAAVRTERYSDFGSTTNPKLGVDWEPASGLLLRGSYGKSFRAPTLQELRQDPGTRLTFIYPLPDPDSPTGSSNVIIIRGNDPALGPERATTWTLGGEIKPNGLPGFHASATYFNIDYRDRIASPITQVLSFLIDKRTYAGITEFNPSADRINALYASPDFYDAVGIPKTAPIKAVINAQTQNLSVVKQSGMDFDAGYTFKLGHGHAEIGGNATYIFSIKQGLSAGAPLLEVANVLGNPVNFKGRGRASWSSDRLSAVLFANYVGSYVNKSTGTNQPVSSWTTFDLQLTYHIAERDGLLNGVRVALGATNLFDRNPPFAAYYVGNYTSGYDPENASPMKRVISLQVTKSW